jgi:ABC-2 type transport system permease protein
MTIFRFVFKRFFRKSSNVVLLFAISFFAIFMTAEGWLGLPIGFQYYGILQMVVAARLASIILEDRVNHILLRIGAAPVTHFKYLRENLLAYTLLLIFQNAVVITIGIFIHGEKLIAPFMLFMLYSLFSVTAVAISLAWYASFRNKEAAALILMNLIILMAMLGGLMWPIQIMPTAFQSLAMLIPTYWLAEGMMLIVGGAPAVQLILPFVIILMFALALLLLGSRRRIA